MRTREERNYWVESQYGEAELKDCLENLVAIKNGEQVEPENIRDSEKR